jgi:hypothetical protein
MYWLTHCVFGSHVVAWLALGVVVVLTLTVRIGARSLIFWVAAHKRDRDKSEKEYWRMHGEE